MYHTEQLDEIIIKLVREHNEHKLVFLSNKMLDFDDKDKDDHKKRKEKLNYEHKAAKDFLEAALVGKFSRVKMTNLLDNSLTALVKLV